MNETTEKLIRELSEKLGTTTEHLWEVLIAQARIDFWVTTIQYILVFVFGFLLVKLTKKFYKNIDELKRENYDLPLALILIIVWFVFGIIALVAFFSIGMWGASLFNPEYWALKQILK